MNAPNAPALFASVRSSKDHALAAFAGALLVAFALHAGAFLPRLDAPETAGNAPAIDVAPQAPARAVVARGRGAVTRSASAAAPEPEPCPAPRG